MSGQLIKLLRGLQPQTPRPIRAGDSASLRESVDRWYSRTGGVDKEIESAQRNLQQEGSPFGLYGHWEPDAASRRVPVEEARAGRLREKEDGLFDQEQQKVLVQPGRTPDRAVIEHELTHGATLPQLSGGWGGLFESMNAHQPVWLADAATFDPRPDGEIASGVLRDVAQKQAKLMGDAGVSPEAIRAKTAHWQSNPEYADYVQYIARMGEVDPRLAEIRRMYSHATGNPVRNADDAKVAWQWWQDNASTWNQWATPGNKPTIGMHATRLYDAFPDSAKKVMWQRMPQIFALMLAAGAGAGASKQQGPVTQELLK